MFRTIYTAAFVSLIASGASAETLQIQLHGEMPNRVTANLVFEDTLSSDCKKGPCTIEAQRVTIRRHSSGVGVVNVDVPKEATRVCLQRLNGASMLSTVLYMNNNRKHMTKRGGNIHKDGSGGCSSPKAKVTSAKVWVVKVD